jgi:hypothetical protein
VPGERSDEIKRQCSIDQLGDRRHNDDARLPEHRERNVRGPDEAPGMADRCLSPCVRPPCLDEVDRLPHRADRIVHRVEIGQIIDGLEKDADAGDLVAAKKAADELERPDVQLIAGRDPARDPATAFDQGEDDRIPQAAAL